MGMRENFKQAINELFPVLQKKEDGEDTIKSLEIEILPEQHSTPQPQEAEQTQTRPREFYITKITEEKKVMNGFTDMVSSGDVSIISADTKITGTLRSRSAICVSGEIQGDVISDETVTVKGLVTGNVKCKNAIFENCRIVGNITAMGDVEIGTGTVIVGDVAGVNVNAYGKVKGNISSTGAVVLKNPAYIVGDISGATLEISGGAAIKGALSITNVGDVTFED